MLCVQKTEFLANLLSFNSHTDVFSELLLFAFLAPVFKMYSIDWNWRNSEYLNLQIFSEWLHKGCQTFLAAWGSLRGLEDKCTSSSPFGRKLSLSKSKVEFIVFLFICNTRYTEATHDYSNILQVSSSLQCQYASRLAHLLPAIFSYQSFCFTSTIPPPSFTPASPTHPSVVSSPSLALCWSSCICLLLLDGDGANDRAVIVLIVECMSAFFSTNH